MFTVSPFTIFPVSAGLTGATPMRLSDSFVQSHQEQLQPRIMAEPSNVVDMTGMPVAPSILERELPVQTVLLDERGGANAQLPTRLQSGAHMMGGDDVIQGPTLWIVPTLASPENQADRIILGLINQATAFDAHKARLHEMYDADDPIYEAALEEGVNDIFEGEDLEMSGKYGTISLDELSPGTRASLVSFVESGSYGLNDVIRAIKPSDRFCLIRGKSFLDAPREEALSLIKQCFSVHEICECFGLTDIEGYEKLAELAVRLNKQQLLLDASHVHGDEQEKILAAIYQRLYPEQNFEQAEDEELARVYICYMLLLENMYVEEHQSQITQSDDGSINRLKGQFVTSQQQEIYSFLNLIFLDDELDAGTRDHVVSLRGDLSDLPGLPAGARDDEAGQIISLFSRQPIQGLSDADRRMREFLASLVAEERLDMSLDDDMPMVDVLETSQDATKRLFDAGVDVDKEGQISLEDLHDQTITEIVEFIAMQEYYLVLQVLEKIRPSDRMALLLKVHSLETINDVIYNVLLGHNNMKDVLAFFGLELSEAEVNMAKELVRDDLSEQDVLSKIIQQLFPDRPTDELSRDQKIKIMAIYSVFNEMNFLKKMREELGRAIGSDYRAVLRRYQQEAIMLNKINQHRDMGTELSENQKKQAYAQAMIAGRVDDADVDVVIKAKVDSDAEQVALEDNRRLFIEAGKADLIEFIKDLLS